MDRVDGPLQYGQSGRPLAVWTVYGQRGNLSLETCIAQAYSCRLLVFYGTYRNSQGTLNGPLQYGQSAQSLSGWTVYGRSLTVYGHSGLSLTVWTVYGQRGNLSQETCIAQSYSCGLPIFYVRNIQKVSGNIERSLIVRAEWTAPYCMDGPLLYGLYMDRVHAPLLYGLYMDRGEICLRRPVQLRPTAAGYSSSMEEHTETLRRPVQPRPIAAGYPSYMEHRTYRNSQETYIAQAYSCGLLILYQTYRNSQGTCIAQDYSCGLLIFCGTHRNSQGTFSVHSLYGYMDRREICLRRPVQPRPIAYVCLFVCVCDQF